MASNDEKADSIRKAMLASIRSLVDMLDPLIFDPLVFPDNTIGMIEDHFEEEQYELVLWKVTYCLNLCVSEREKARIGKHLLESWQHAITFQEIRLKNEGETDDIRQERKSAVSACKEGKRRAQRSLDETVAVQMLRMYMYGLIRTLDERSYKRFHEVEDDIQNAYFIDALFKLSQSASVVKNEHRLVLLMKAWEKLYEHDKYRVEHIEEISRERYFGGKYDKHAHIILNEKRQDVKGCEEGIQIVAAHYKALEEAKGRPWWHWPKPGTKEHKQSDSSTKKQEQNSY